MHPALVSARPLVFAHRGGGGLGPENTLIAFDRGLAAGADGLELDVHLSRDGIVVVHHDRLLDRTTTGSGRIADCTAAELAALDATSRFKAGEPRAGVPTLNEVLRRYPGIPIIVELKGSSPALARAAIDEIRDARAAERVCIGSSSWRALRAVRAYEPRLATSAARVEVRLALYRSRTGWLQRGAAYQVFQVPELSGRTRIVSPRFIRWAHEAGIAVQVWTVDATDDIRRLLDWGVDGIITDRPDVAVDVLQDWGRK